MTPEASTSAEGAAVCTPCRAIGRLISGLGGEPHAVVCPWCRGTGRRIAGIDAQQEGQALRGHPSFGESGSAQASP